jgi:hypothetical protein
MMEENSSNLVPIRADVLGPAVGSDYSTENSMANKVPTRIGHDSSGRYRHQIYDSVSELNFW